MKKALIFATALLGFGVAFAQEDSPTGYSSFFTLAGSRYEPAILGDDEDDIHIGVINSYIWAGNNTFTIQDLETINGGSLFGSGDDPFTEEEFNAILPKLKDINRVGFGTTIEPFNFGMRINKPGTGDDDGKNKEELFTFSLGYAARFEANFQYSNDLFQLAWRGNKQYAGQTVNFPFALNAIATSEYTIGMAMPIPWLHLMHDDLSLRMGAKGKIINGIGAIYTERADLSIFTEQDGRYVEIGYDYLIHSSHNPGFDLDESGDSTQSEFDPSTILSGGPGKGFAFDLGISGHYKERWFLNLNFLDIGGVTFKGENNYAFKNQGTITFDGVGLDNPMNDTYREVDTSFYEIWEGVEELEGEDFRVPYPQRMRMHASYRIPREDKHGNTYWEHSVGLTMIQGFKDIGNATKATYLAAAYTYNLKSHLEVGSNFGFRGYNIVEIGFFTAMKFGPFRMGIGSGNIISPIAKSIGTGADFNYNLTFAF